MSPNDDDPGRRIIGMGSIRWKDTRTTLAALRRVERVYKPPYTLLHNGTLGAAQYLAVNAKKRGWTIELHDADLTKCAPDCPTENHRRRGGPAGDYCPSARARALQNMLDSGADLLIALVVTDGTRLGQKEASSRGLAVWEYVREVNRGDKES